MPYFLKPRETETPQKWGHNESTVILHHGPPVTKKNITSQGAVGVTWYIKRNIIGQSHMGLCRSRADKMSLILNT